VITDGRQPLGTISRGTLLRWVNNLVVVQGASDDRECGDAAAACADSARAPASPETADALVEQAQVLAQRLRQNGDDPVATVVGGVSNIQDMLDDLMGHARKPRLRRRKRLGRRGADVRLVPRLSPTGLRRRQNRSSVRPSVGAVFAAIAKFTLPAQSRYPIQLASKPCPSDTVRSVANLGGLDYRLHKACGIRGRRKPFAVAAVFPPRN